jgi:hypothetical protein
MKRCAYTLVLALLASGCSSSLPRGALKLGPESLERRSLQTRRFEGISEVDLLAASAGVIQDLGFQIDEAETGLGLIVGSKQRTARKASQIAAAVLIGILTLGESEVATDRRQEFRVSLVVRPLAEGPTDAHFVRVTFQRVIWRTDNSVSCRQSLTDPEMYQEFFGKLSNAVFLEAHRI